MKITLTEISDLNTNVHITISNLTGGVNENLSSISTSSNEDFTLTTFDLQITTKEAIQSVMTSTITQLTDFVTFPS